jgi:hypothetical protein
MADFRGTILTVRGRNLLAKAQTGVQLRFTKIKIGDGLWDTNTDPTQLDDLVSPKLSLSIQDIRVVGDGTVRLRFVLTNTGLSQGFFMREIGIYAQDPDVGEILYAVAYAGDRADFIPSDGVTKVENVVDIYTVIANAENVTAVISDTVVLATKEDIDTIKPEAGSTPPSITYPGKLWVNADDFLQYFDGSGWKNVKASFADTVDGFHASHTPAPNVIPVTDSTGKLATVWIPFMFSSVSVITPSANTIYQETAPCLIMVVSQDLSGLEISPNGSTWYGRFGQEHYYSTIEGGTITFYVPKNWYWRFSDISSSTHSSFSNTYWLKIVFNY